jgi:hypothetical protein
MQGTVIGHGGGGGGTCMSQLMINSLQQLQQVIVCHIAWSTLSGNAGTITVT